MLDEPLGDNRGLRSSSVSVFNIDNDSDTDLIIIGEDETGRNRFLVLKNNGNGLFGSISEPLGNNRGFRQGDLLRIPANDGQDRFADLMVSGVNNNGNHNLIKFTNDGKGNFSDSEPLLASQPPFSEEGLINGELDLADADGDTDLDLLVSGSHSNSTPRLLLLTQDNFGNFTPDVEPFGSDNGFNNGSLEWADVDRAGDNDFAVLGEDTSGRNRLFIFKNNGLGEFPFTQEPMGINSGLARGSLAWADMDGDTDLDLAVSGMDNNSNPRLILFENQSGQMVKFSEPIGSNNGFYKSDLEWNDFDRDGDPDLAVMGVNNKGDTEFIIYENNGQGNLTKFAEPLGEDTGLAKGELSWADVNGDQTPDLVAVGEDQTGQPRLVVMENQVSQSGGNDDSSSDDSETFGDIIESIGTPNSIKERLRTLRDEIMHTQLGRAFTKKYYQWLGKIEKK